MNDRQEKKRSVDEPVLARQVGNKAARKLAGQQAQRDSARLVWSGVSMMGLVGWSVVLPTVLGAALGAWLGPALPHASFMDTDAPVYRSVRRVPECVVLGGAGR